MSPDWANAVASVVAAMASAIGLFAIWRTLRTSEAQSKNSVYQLVTTRMSAISRSFLDMPELRPYFYDCEDDSNLKEKPELYSRVNIMCEMLFDHIEMIVEQPKVMGLVGESYERYFDDLLHSSPALQNYWQKNRSWYVPRLQRFVDEVLKNPPPMDAA